MKRVYFFCCTILGLFISIPVGGDTWYTYFANTIVAAVVVSTIDVLIYVSAFWGTGFLNGLSPGSSDDRSRLHWKIRCGLTLAIVVLSFTSVLSWMLGGLITAIGARLIDAYRSAMQDITEAFTQMIQNWGT